MNIFKNTTLTWKQLSLMKWAIFFIGISVGATWPEIFEKYAFILFIIGMLISAYLFVIWMRNK